jgi:feruloyl esterase
MAEARAVNKIWYGPRTTGEAVEPSQDNGWHAKLAPGQLWFGYPRGAILHGSPVTFGYGPAGPVPSTIGSDWLAIVLGDPSYTSETFQNASGTGQNRWKEIGYSEHPSFTDVMLASVDKFSALIATDQPDLAEFKSAGGKIIHWHGIDDNIIPAAGSVHYYERVVETMGGLEPTRDFYRFYLGPGIGHGAPGVEHVSAPVPGGNVSGDVTAGPNNNLLPLLQDWVERDIAPGSIAAVSDESEIPALTRPWCAYPDQVRYIGGPIGALSSYECN